jgi:hypothetical protein
MPNMTASTANDSVIQPEIERNYRWNFLVNSLDGASFWFGMSFFSSTIILPLFVSHFTNNPLVIGLIAFIGWGESICRSFLLPTWSSARPLKSFFL